MPYHQGLLEPNVFQRGGLLPFGLNRARGLLSRDVGPGTATIPDWFGGLLPPFPKQRTGMTDPLDPLKGVPTGEGSGLTFPPEVLAQIDRERENQRRLIEQKKYREAAKATPTESRILSGMMLGAGIIKPIGATPSQIAMRANQAKWDKQIKAEADKFGVSPGLLSRLHETAAEGVQPPPLLGRGGIAPPAGATVEKTAGEYAALAREGEGGKYFYPIGGEVLKERMADPMGIRPYAATISHTSSQTPFGTNVQYSTRGLNQWMAGQPINVGMRPNMMSPRVLEAFETGGGGVTGPKHVPYMESFGRYAGMTPWEKTIAVVNDRWNMRGLGYGGDYAGTPGTGQHNFARLVAADATKILNKDADLAWTVDMTQAAVWHTLRMRSLGRSPGEAAIDLRSVLDDQAFQAVHETVQGKTTGSRMLGRSYQEKQEYHNEAQAVLEDEAGRDIISSAFGLITRPGKPVGGAFGAGVNPATVHASAVGQKAGAFGVMDAASRELAETVELTHALLKRQDEATFTAPYFKKTISDKDKNFWLMDIGRPLSTKETSDLYRVMEKNFGTPDMVPIGDYNGAWFSNYLGLPAREFRDKIAKSIDEVFPGEVSLLYGRADNFWAKNDWSVNRNGEDYFRSLGQKPPHLQARSRELLALLGPRIVKVEDSFIQRGWSINTNTRFWETPGFTGTTGQAPISGPLPLLPRTLPRAGFFSAQPGAP